MVHVSAPAFSNMISSTKGHVAVLSAMLLWTIGVVKVYSSESPSYDSSVRAAGCLIPTSKGVVMGVNRLLGTIQLPVGRHLRGESPRQTAARETLEETGLDVDVGPLLVKIEKDEVYLYLCTPKKPITDYSSLQPKDTREVSEVVVVNPHTMINHDGTPVQRDWRFAETRIFLRALFPEFTDPDNFDGD